MPKAIMQKKGYQMNTAKLLIHISMTFSITGIVFLIMFFVNTEQFRWGLVAALICIVTGNLINLLRMKMVGKKKR